MSVQRACRLSDYHRSRYYYRACKHNKDDLVIEQLQRLALDHPRYGFWKMHYRLRYEGYEWNHKRVYRIYKSLGLNLRRKHKRRLPMRVKEPLTQPQRANEVWSLDFMSDSLYHGRRFRTLNIIDDYNREICWLEIAMSITAENVVRVIDYIIEQRGKPQQLRVDNGPEFISECFVEFCRQKNIRIHYIQPGKPTQNAYIERFNRTYRTEVLDAYLFKSICDVKTITYDWVHDYNHHRTHQSLNHLPPISFANQSIKC